MGGTVHNKMYVPLRGEVKICCLGFKQRAVSWDSFGVVGQISRTSLICPQTRNVTYINVGRNYTMDRVIVTIIVLFSVLSCSIDKKDYSLRKEISDNGVGRFYRDF